jgi:hypothetical protein
MIDAFSTSVCNSSIEFMHYALNSLIKEYVDNHKLQYDQISRYLLGYSKVRP